MSAEALTGDLKSALHKILWRLMPFLVLGHAIAAIDRLNISFAKLRMAQDIGLSDAAYGLGAGIFYLGYILFEVPSNLYLQRMGARATLTRIMLLWGMVSLGTAFVTTPNQLLVARFLLGVAEAGFFPGVILYMTYWFPAALRGRVTAVFLMSAVAAGALSGPLAGWIMTGFEGWQGLRGWQALFVLEGIPAILLALWGWFKLGDKPAGVAWLSPGEKRALADAMAADGPRGVAPAPLREVLTDVRVYIAGMVYFCLYSGTNTVGYWSPTLIRGLGIEDLQVIGLLAGMPFALAVFGMYLLGRSSDRRQERRWHVALCMLVSAGCFFLLGFVQNQAPLALGLMIVGAAGGLCAISLFWTIPPAFLPAAHAAAGIAMISAFGNLAAVLSQSAVGAIKMATGSLFVAFDVIAVALVIGAGVVLVLIPARQLRGNRAPAQPAHAGSERPMSSTPLTTAQSGS